MWTIRTLGEICDEVDGVIQTGPFGSQLHESDYVNDGIPVVMPKNILDGKVDTSDIAFINQEDADRLERHKMSVGDIVYGRRGNIGRRALVGTREHGWLCGTGCLRVSLSDRVLDPTYLYYFLGQPMVVNWIANQAVGATMPNLNTGILRSVAVRYPRLPIQRRIASILSAYDDLIENNTRRINILEDMAQMLYREWFVNFRFPRHENVNMIESDIGRLPQGWSKPFSEVVDFREGPGLRKWEFQNSGVPFLIVRSLLENDIDVSKSHCISLRAVETKYRHFLLADHDHVVSSSGTLGRVVTIRSRHLPLLLNTGIIRMRATTPAFGCWQIKHFLKSEYFQSQIRSFAIGVAQIHFGPFHLRQMKAVVPPIEIGTAYESGVTPIEELIGNLVQKNANLRTTRDFLLPKLISGEIPVDAAAEAMEQTA